jgi:hypothetical protein
VRVVIVPVNRDESEEASIVGLRSTENFDFVAAAALNADGLLAKRVLVDGDELFIL